MVPYIIVELKKPKLTDGKEQLKSYCNATGAPNTDDFAQELFAMYPISMRKVMDVFPQYFFQTFFQINREFSYEEKTIDLDKDGNLKERYQANLHIVDKHILKFYLGISDQFRTTKYNESIKKEIDLRPIIRAVVEKHRYQNLIINEIQFIP